MRMMTYKMPFVLFFLLTPGVRQEVFFVPHTGSEFGEEVEYV